MDDLTTLAAQIAEVKALTEENNRVLKAMRRDALIGGIVKTLIWLVLIIASFYFSAKLLEPYLGLLQGGQEGQSQDFQQILDQYRQMMGE